MRTEAQKKAMAKYGKNQEKRGMARLTIWIPEEDRPNILRYIRRKRTAFMNKGGK